MHPGRKALDRERRVRRAPAPSRRRRLVGPHVGRAERRPDRVAGAGVENRGAAAPPRHPLTLPGLSLPGASGTMSSWPRPGRRLPGGVYGVHPGARRGRGGRSTPSNSSRSSYRTGCRHRCCPRFLPGRGPDHAGELPILPFTCVLPVLLMCMPPSDASPRTLLHRGSSKPANQDGSVPSTQGFRPACRQGERIARRRASSLRAGPGHPLMDPPLRTRPSESRDLPIRGRGRQVQVVQRRAGGVDGQDELGRLLARPLVDEQR